MPEDLGAQVRNELFKLKWSQKKLAEMVGISEVYLSDIIRGKRNGPKVQEHIKHIRKILDI
ncbi:transcriptional regulator [Lysinibacillus sp. B2A1]|nr:transcriptional regulator [Lysinibacillus sp. B2A1]